MHRLAILLLIVMLFGQPLDAQCPSGRKLPKETHALYVGVPNASKASLPKVLDLARRAKVNALVVDVKDTTGRVALNEAAGIPLVTMEPEADRIDMAQLKAFRKNGGWLIGRVAMFLDPCLANRRTDFAIKRKDGTLYAEGEGGPCGATTFTSPFLDPVWDYNIAIARKAVEAGFDEIQLDYVRFPDQEDAIVPPKSEWNNSSRLDAITLGVARVRAALPASAALSVDTFGRTVRESDAIIGQDVRLLAPYVDYISPMLYPSLWPAGSFGIDTPVAKPYETISESLKALEEWMSHTPCPPRVRPWFQTGDWPVLPYGRKETQAQIQAAKTMKTRDWALWQAEGTYDPEAIK